MVYLNRIYTRGGDTGETSLGNGQRVPKTSARIVAYGTVDELNSAIGVAIAAGADQETARHLRRIQNDLFDVGADLCVPESKTPPEFPPLRVVALQAEWLERRIDAATEKLQPLTSFILPGGSVAAAHLHLARTVCRRAEIAVLELAAEEPVNPQVIVYLNRLSDYLFVIARLANNAGRDDVLWTPGQHRDAAE